MQMNRAVFVVLLVLAITVCHAEEKQDSVAVSKASIAADKSCTKCHLHKKLLQLPSKHSPAVKDCMLCHDRHGKTTGQPRRLFKPLNDLCLSCHHEEKFKGRGHPVKNHPTYLKEWKETPGKEFNCLACHNPHSTKSKNLIRYDFKAKPYQGNLCKVCHSEFKQK